MTKRGRRKEASFDSIIKFPQRIYDYIDYSTMDYQRQISEFLLIETCVTTTWVANALHLPVTKAASILADYKKSHKDVHATFLVNGRDNNQNFTFTIAVEEEVENVKKSLATVSSSQIYSLQRVPTESIKSQIVDTYMNLATSLLADPSTVTSDSFVANGLGQIVMKDLDVRPVGERILSTQNIHWTKGVHVPSSSTTQTASAKSSSLSASSSIQSAPAVAQIKNSDQVKAFFNKPTQSKIDAKPEAKPEPKNFFKSSSTNSQPEVDADQVRSQSQESEPRETLKAKKAETIKSPAKKVTKDDEDEEFDDGSAPVVGKKRNTSTSDKKPKVTNNLEESDEEETEQADEVKAKKSKTAKVNVNVRGALDDFMEDIAIEQYKKEQENPTQKKKKKVLVEKMFADEKGYLVTEMVWEEVTDDEQPNLSEVKPQKPKVEATTKSTSESKPAASTAAKGKKDSAPAKPSSGTQKNMMSFFTKK